ncbi:hypothetical protein cyc_01719 [Cyclospora cayetanensis]|uniref:Uncharacterized protein n=1 Tax=Cyclospora cayetanensis TaxID=88456 RepID=A0A1D3D7B2_9EIME|nr:hypothetical protein cyc_01719 [Cyclospora cayetanensis]
MRRGVLKARRRRRQAPQALRGRMQPQRQLSTEFSIESLPRSSGAFLNQDAHISGGRARGVERRRGKTSGGFTPLGRRKGIRAARRFAPSSPSIHPWNHSACSRDKMLLRRGLTQQPCLHPQRRLPLPPRRLFQQQPHQHATPSLQGRLSVRVARLQRQWAPLLLHQGLPRHAEAARRAASHAQPPQQEEPPEALQQLSPEERRGLLQQLLLRLDESFKEHHASWLPMQQQRGGGRAAKRSLQKAWDPQDLSALECFFVLLRLVRSRRDWQTALRGFQLLNNFGRLPSNRELSDRLAAAAALCGQHAEACAVAECSRFLMASPPSVALFFALLEDAIDRRDTAAANRLFACLREDWRLHVSPASYVLMLRSAVTPECVHLDRCAALYDDAMALGVALPLEAHVLLLEFLLTRASCAAALPTRPAEEETDRDSGGLEVADTARQGFDRSAAECLRMAHRVRVYMREDSAAFNSRPLPPRALLLQAWLSFLECKLLLKPSEAPTALAMGFSLLQAACARKIACFPREAPWSPPAPLLSLLRNAPSNFPGVSTAELRKLARAGRRVATAFRV